MNDKQKLGFKIACPLGMPPAQLEYLQVKYEKELGYKLIQEISNGDVYSVQLKRDTWQNEEMESMDVSLWLGRVQRVNVPPMKAPKRLGFMSRLHVLFTGWIPLRPHD